MKTVTNISDIIDNFEDKFCVMIERSGRDNGYSAEQWSGLVEHFLRSQISELLDGIPLGECLDPDGDIVFGYGIRVQEDRNLISKMKQ